MLVCLCAVVVCLSFLGACRRLQTMGTPEIDEDIVNVDGGNLANNRVNGGGGGGQRDEECERLKPTNCEHTITAYGAANSNQENGIGGEMNATKRHSLVLRRGDTELSIDHGGIQRFLPKFMHFSFADREAEQLYQQYYSNEKRSDFKALIVIVVFVNVVLLGLHLFSGGHLSGRQLIILCCCLILAVFLFILCLRRSRDALASRLWSLIPFALWLVMLVQIICDLSVFVGRTPEPSGSICWLLLYSYSTYVIFPLRFRICCALSILMAAIHTVFVLTFSDFTYKFVNQVTPNYQINPLHTIEYQRPQPNSPDPQHKQTL